MKNISELLYCNFIFALIKRPVARGHAGTMPTAIQEHVFVTRAISANSLPPGDVQVQCYTFQFFFRLWFCLEYFVLLISPFISLYFCQRHSILHIICIAIIDRLCLCQIHCVQLISIISRLWFCQRKSIPLILKG